MLDFASNRSAWAFVKIAVGVAVLAVALWSVPWRDKARVATTEGVVVVRGEIVGPWDGDRAEFRISPRSAPAAGWPEGWEEAQRTGAVVVLDRDLAQLGEGDLDWTPGLVSVITELKLNAMLMALGSIALGIVASVVRWWRLLWVAGCPMPFRAVFRLSLLGLFFSLVVPGTTGGDVVKTALVVRENPGRRAEAFASAIIDRLLGIVGLLLLASAVVLIVGEPLGHVRAPVLASSFVALILLAGLLHSAPRRWIRLEHWIGRLPQARRVARLDQALLGYRAHPGTVAFGLALSVFNHACVAVAVHWIAQSMGSPLALGTTLCIVSIASIAGALPLSPGGLGVEEAVYAGLFGLFGASPALGLAAGLTKRALLTVLRLAGAAGLFTSSARGLGSVASDTGRGGGGA